MAQIINFDLKVPSEFNKQIHDTIHFIPYLGNKGPAKTISLTCGRILESKDETCTGYLKIPCLGLARTNNISSEIQIPKSIFRNAIPKNWDFVWTNEISGTCSQKGAGRNAIRVQHHPSLPRPFYVGVIGDNTKKEGSHHI
ncbi:hypothetical protein NPIL_656071 [Nephila pilipes]|uniref:Uncharacterized protein n=1 Tax=Nephila pilipes TaxID=299642 RepID=A0A8X6U483_NEPPI|nr:hypothetical protein NPIL_656071 [Nephila pilipes]